MGIHALAQSLSLLGIEYTVIAGRKPAETSGHEQFVNVAIKTNNKGQASVAWLAFLKRIGVNPTPHPYNSKDEKDAHYSVCYMNAKNAKNATVFIICENRPDLAVHGKPSGWVGSMVLFVFPNSDLRFGTIRSALVIAASTGVSATRRKNKSHADKQLDAAMSDPNRNAADIVEHEARNAQLHSETMKALRDLGMNRLDAETFSELYHTTKEEISKRMQEDREAGGTGEASDAAEHVVIATQIHFKTTSERLQARKKAKLYRQKNKSKLKLKSKVYRKKMKHKKPNALRSRIAKLVAKHYHRGTK